MRSNVLDVPSGQKYPQAVNDQENSNSRSSNTGAEESQQSRELYAPFLDGTSTIDTTQEQGDPASTFTFTSNAFDNQNSKNNLFTFQQRAKDSTSTSQISSRIANNRELRKSEFTNRLRRSRRDERDARGIESFEKAEYWRDRREREIRLSREVTGYDNADQLDETSDGLDDFQDDTGMSPVDEDREVQEMVEAYYYDRNHDSFDQNQGREAIELGNDLDIEIEDGEGYDEAFMEVLSQAEADQGLFSLQPSYELANNERLLGQHESGAFGHTTASAKEDDDLEMS